MGFEIKDKVAIITGGASGLGFEHAKELLRNGLRAVTLADINDNVGQHALNEIKKEFGPNRAIYVHVDVSNKKQFEEAFERTIEAFRNIDILINNAGILNDSDWEREIAVNINGTVNGILLGFENYIPKFKSGEEGLVVNTSSTAALGIMPFFPIYTGTKMAVLGISRSLADAEHYARTKVKVIILCPGATDTQLLQDCAKGAFTPAYQEMMERRHNPPSQSPLRVARGLVEIIGQADHGSVWVVAVGRKPYEVELPEQIGKIKQHGKLDPNVF